MLKQNHQLRAAIVILAMAIFIFQVGIAYADSTTQTLPFSQNWGNTGLITAADDWSGVPGITGYLGQNITTATGADPQTLLTESALVGDLTVLANQTSTGITNGDVAEFEITDPTIALQGSGTADAPYILIAISTTALSNVNVSYNLRDLDGSADNAVQPVALQYRVGNTGNFTNIPVGYVADATSGPSLATMVTPVSATLPAAADNQSLVQIRIITANAVGNDEWVGVDDLSITGSAIPGIYLSITDVTVSEGNSGTTNFTFSVNLSSPAPAGGVTFDIATQDNSASTADGDYDSNSLTSQTILENASAYEFTVTVNGDTAVEGNETFYVNVSNVAGTGITVNDSQGVGTITNDDIAITRIHDIQGSGSAVTDLVTTFTVEAIVVGDFQTQGSGQLKGFFIQEEDADADANAATSEGIFVYCNTCPDAVNVGDKVRVTGLASDFFDMSQLNAPAAGNVVVLSTGNTLPTPASINLPIPGVPTGDVNAAKAVINAFYEPFEGMLVNFTDTLAISEYFELARYGQVELTETSRMFTFTATNAPSVSGYTDHQIELLSRMIILDDGDNRENRPIDPTNTAYFHPYPGLSTTNYFRGGDTISNLTGVLHWSFNGTTGSDAWRIRPVTEAYTYAFTPVNTRPAMPTVDGRLKVASFNVLNYFLNVDTSNVCGPTADQDCRGADTSAEFTRQRNKLLAALTSINADVFGLMEMENTPGSEPLADLVAGMPGYAYIDTGVIGTDTIRVGIIYKTSTVTPVGSFAVLDTTDFIDPLSTGSSRNRPALAQTFEETSSGQRFTVVVNHLKSKGCSGSETGSDVDAGDGQSCWAGTRTAAAQKLVSWLASNPTGSGDPDFLIIGDLNSNALETPITTLTGLGYTNLVSLYGGPSAYGYVFDGQLGYLDHALSSASLTAQIADLAEWHINADENPLFDYNDDVKDAGESAFEEESDVLPLYEVNQFRTSDHDPVIIGLNLDNTDPVVTVPADKTVEATSASGAVVTFASEVSATDETAPATPAVTCSPASGSTFPLGETNVDCSATDNAGNTGHGYFKITVQDTTAPALDLPADKTVEAASSAGAVVSFASDVSATDDVDASPTVECTPASGSIFALGTTTVTCTATDDAANSSNGTFDITVQDTTAPALDLPANMTVPPTGPSGAVVNFTVTATDEVDASPTVECTPASGSTFALGTTTVNCTATDDATNSSNGSFDITVSAANNTPTDIALSKSSVDENQPVGTAVGTLSTTDPDAGDSHTYSLCGGTDDASFQISADSLQTSAIFDYETKNSYSICIRTDDGNGGTFDETFAISVNNLVEIVTATFKSFGPLDGWTLESGENTTRGGSINFGKVSFRLGDTMSRRQYRSILSFDTSSLPDNAIITKVTLKVMREKVVGGGDPVSAFQGFLIDIRKGTFGTSALQALDFQARANKTYGPFVVAPVANWFSFDLTSAKPYVNKLVTTGGGLTQIRLRFQLDDDGNSLNNYLSLYSGNAGPLRRPQLIIEYQLP